MLVLRASLASSGASPLGELPNRPVQEAPDAKGRWRTPPPGDRDRTVQNRVVLAALKLVLEPFLEANFQPCSYG